VFPGSYPENTPEGVQRPTAPSCRPCNGKFRKLEIYLLGSRGLCIDPEIVTLSLLTYSMVFLIDDEAAERLATGFGRPRFYLGLAFEFSGSLRRTTPDTRSIESGSGTHYSCMDQ
jgi:hypothetical protein